MIEFGPEPEYESEGGWGEADHPDEVILKILNAKKKKKRKNGTYSRKLKQEVNIRRPIV